LGYFGIWALVGVVTYFGLILLFGFYPSFSMMGRLDGLAAGVAILLAGAYQLSPLKQKALQACRSPMNFIMTKWRNGSKGSLVMGFDYGWFCTKCCWAFMAVLVVVGAMNLLWMILFAGIIFIEKIAPRGKILSKGLGVVLIAVGMLLAAIPSFVG
jgi:predicted metal-binding membrane protein